MAGDWLATDTYYNPGVLGGSGPNTLKYTKAQVGNAYRPNPAPSGVKGWAGAVSSPGRQPIPAPASEQPLPNAPSGSWLGNGWGAPGTTPEGFQGTQRASGATTFKGSPTTTQHGQYGLPGDPGQPVVRNTFAVPFTPDRHVPPQGGALAGAQSGVDPRRQWSSPDQAGNPLPASDAAYPLQTIEHWTPLAGVYNLAADRMGPDSTPPAGILRSQRPYGGQTSVDNYRSSRRWIATFNRPFDYKVRAGTNLGNRHLMPAPLASTPYVALAPAAGRVPSAGGGQPIVGMTPFGPRKNTVRLIPQPWDTNLMNAGAGVPATASWLAGGA